MSDSGEPSIPPSLPNSKGSGSRPFVRLLIALAPAILAHLVGVIGVRSIGSIDEGLWFPLCLILLAVGAILSGVFLVKAVSRGNVELHVIVKIVLFVTIALVYFGAFFFSGCLVITMSA